MRPHSRKSKYLLSAKRVSGERPWRHFHYLRGSIYCGECGRRLIYNRAKGKGGLYEYFTCGGRQPGNCKQRAHRVQAVEAAIEQHYATKELTDQERDSWRSAVTAHIESITTLAAEKRITGMGVEHDQVLKALDLALALTDDIQAAYLQAGPQERRLLNQGLFERLEIDSEEVVAGQDAEPFDQLRHLGKGWNQTIYVPRHKAKTPDPLAKVGSLNVESLVPLQRFVPNGEIVVPVEAALDLAPQKGKRAHDLMELLQRLHGEAERVLLESITERESREEDAATNERYQRGYDACEELLADLDPRS